MPDTAQPATKEPKKKPVLGIISIILGGVSLLPFLGIASLAGLVTGIVAIIRERRVYGIIGAVLSVAGIATSPTVWALLLSLWVRVDCMVADCSTKFNNAVQQTMNNPDVQKKIKKFASQGTSSSFSVNLPDEWKQVEGNARSIYAGTNFFTRHYWTAPKFKAVILQTMGDKKDQESIDVFITQFVQEHLKAKNPNLQITPMNDVKIHNLADAEKNLAHLRVFSGTSLGTQELVAYVDGGSKVFMFIVAAPTYEDLKAVWPVFYTSLINGVNFHVSAPSATPPAASKLDQHTGM